MSKQRGFLLNFNKQSLCPLLIGQKSNVDFIWPLKQVTAAADFQKDLSLDSLDRVELVMAFEEEFSFEIPEEKADKLTCCADVAKYIVSGGEQKIVNPE